MQDAHFYKKPEVYTTYSKHLDAGDILISYKDITHPLSWFGHSAIVVGDNAVGEYPKILTGYHENHIIDWMKNRDVKIALRYKNNTALFKKRLLQNIDDLKHHRYKITHKTDTSGFYCSQYIWYLFWKTAKDLGYQLDIDKDKGYFVTPYDLINKQYFHKISIDDSKIVLQEI